MFIHIYRDYIHIYIYHMMMLYIEFLDRILYLKLYDFTRKNQLEFMEKMND